MRSGVVSIATASSSGVGSRSSSCSQLALDAVQLVDRLDHVHGHADRARLVGDAARDGLADPPRRVGRELVAAAPVVLLDGAHQADVALLDEIEEEHAAADVAFRDGHHEPQVGLDQLPARGRVVALDALGERDLLGRGEQRHAADLAQVGAHRVVRAVAHGDVDRRGPLSTSGSSSSSSSTAMTSKPCASRAGRLLVVVGIGHEAEQLRAGELVLVIRIVACQGVRHSGSARAWRVRAPGAAGERLKLRELPHLLGSYLGCSELLLEGFQSTFDPARLDSAGNLPQRTPAPRALPPAPRARPRGAARLVRTEVRPGSVVPGPRHARRRRSSWVNASARYPVEHSQARHRRSRARAPAAAARRAAPRPCGRRAGASSETGCLRTLPGAKSRLRDRSGRRRRSRHDAARARRRSGVAGALAEDARSALVGLLAPVGLRAVDRRRATSETRNASTLCAPAEHRDRRPRGRSPRPRRDPTRAAAARRARADPPRRSRRARGRAARRRCPPRRRRRAARRCARACAARAAAAASAPCPSRPRRCRTRPARARSRRCSPRRRSPPRPSRSRVRARCRP